MALNPSNLSVAFRQTYDTYAGGTATTNFNSKINELNDGDYIIVVTSQDACYPLNSKECLQKIGGTLYTTETSTYREAYALIGKSKLGKGNGIEMFIPKTANNRKYADISVKVSEQGSLLGVNSNNTIDVLDGVNSNVSNLTTRVSNAESKLTKDSLTTTIGSHYTTSTDVNGIVDKKGYATTSQVTQTVNGLQAKFSESGGYNLLRNSGFKKDSLHWGVQSHNSPTGGTIGYLEHTADWGFPNANVKCCQIRLSNQTSKEYGITQTFNTTIGKKYTVSFYYSAHRLTKANMIIRGTSTGSGSWLTNKQFNPSTKSGGKNSINDWALFTHTFTATLNQHTINIVINDAGENGHMWIAQPMIEEGELYTSYSPNPSEVYDGVTTIDKDGITVTANNVRSKTSMSANGFKITKTDNNEDVFKVNSDGTLYMKGQITVTGGTVPNSVLDGTLLSNASAGASAKSVIDQKASGWDSAKSTVDNNANKWNNTSTTVSNNSGKWNNTSSTVDDKYWDWSNAYDRVKEWANESPNGWTTINGGMIATNTITANKIAVGDFNNYSQLRKGHNLSNTYGNAYWSSDNAEWYSSDNYFPVTLDNTDNAFSTGDEINFKATVWIGDGKNVSFGVWFYNANKGHVCNNTKTVWLNYGWNTVNVTIKLNNANINKCPYMQILINNGGTYIGVKDVVINRKITGELIVDGAINGKTIEGAIITSTGSNGDVTTVQGGFIEAKGSIDRSWLGTNEGTQEIKLKSENGKFRARNDSKNRSVYFSDQGLSTTHDGNVLSSGILDFHSDWYGYNRRGLVMYSNNDVGLVARNGYINISPEWANRGYNTFSFQVLDASSGSARDTDGLIYYGSHKNGYGTCIRVSKDINDPGINILDGNMKDRAFLQANHLWTGMLNNNFWTNGSLTMNQSWQGAAKGTQTYLSGTTISATNIYQNGANVSGSDIVLKDNIKEFNNALDIVKRTKVYEFNRILANQDKKEIGFLAQEVPEELLFDKGVFTKEELENLTAEEKKALLEKKTLEQKELRKKEKLEELCEKMTSFYDLDEEETEKQIEQIMEEYNTVEYEVPISTVSQNNIIGVMFQAIKEQQEMIEKLQRKIEEIEG